MWKAFTPVIEFSCRKHLAGKPRHLERRKTRFFKKTHIGYIHHYGRHPKNEADAGFFHNLEKPERKCRHLFRQQREGAAFYGKHAQFKAEYVKNNWGKAANDGIFLHKPRGFHSFHEIQKATVRKHDRLWNSGWAGSIDYTCGVSVNTVIFQIKSLAAFFSCQCAGRHFIYGQYSYTGWNGCLDKGNQQPGFSLTKDCFEALLWRIDVNVHVSVAAVQYSKIGNYCFNALWHEYANYRAFPAVQRIVYADGQLQGAIKQHPERAMAFIVVYGSLFQIFWCHFLEYFNYIYHADWRLNVVFSKIPDTASGIICRQ